MQKKKALLLALINAAVLPSFADEVPSKDVDTLQTVVVTGSRAARNPIDMAATIDVIDRSDITDGKARVDLTEDLNAIAGLQGLNRHNYAQDLQISSRGFGARSTFGVRSLKLIMDGIPASMADGQGQASTFNLDQMQRIEVLQGPLAAIYGNQSGGVIQAFTRDGKGAPTIEVSAEKGSWNTSKEDYSVSGSERGISYLIDDSHFHTDGYRPDSSARRDQQLAKFSFKPTEDGKITFEANNYQQFAKDPLGLTQTYYLKNPMGPLPTTTSPIYPDLAAAYNTRKSILHNQYGINYDQRFSDGSHLQATIYTGNRHVTQFQSTTASATSSTGVIDYARLFYGQDIRWIKDWEFPEGDRLTVTVGIDNDQFQDDRSVFTNYSRVSGSTYVCGSTINCGVYGTLKRHELDTAKSTDPYSQVEWNHGDWTFTGGVRYSHLFYTVNTLTAASGGAITYVHTTPVVGVSYKLSPSTNAYISAANGFESPTMNEMLYVRSGSSVANGFNSTLKASNSKMVEAGVKSFISPNTLLRFDVFSTYMDNETVVDLNVFGQTAYRNAQTQRFGAEWSLDSQITDSISGRGAISLLKAYYSNTGLTIPGVAEKRFFGELIWQPIKGVSLGPEFIASGRIMTNDPYIYTSPNFGMPSPGYGIVNFKVVLHQEFNHWKFKEFLRADNIGDRVYAGSVIVNEGNNRYYEPGAPRSYMAGITGSYQF